MTIMKDQNGKLYEITNLETFFEVHEDLFLRPATEEESDSFYWKGTQK
jgi:hypothetical protein